MSTKSTKAHEKNRPAARQFSFVPFVFFVDRKSA